MTRAFLLPGQNYTGPGNSTSRAYRRRHPPTDALDRASLQHDLRYQRLIEREGRFRTYTHFSGADQAYVRRIQHLPGWRAGLARGVFKLKAALAPTMPKRPRYSPSMGGKRLFNKPKRHQGGSYRPATRPRLTSQGGGKMAGRFAAPSRPKHSKYLSKGYVVEREVNGQNAQSPISYLGFRSLVHKEVGEAIGIAVGRYLLKLTVQADMYDESQLWPTNTAYDATPNVVTPIAGSLCNPLRIEFVFEDTPGSVTSNVSLATWTPTAGTSTLRSFGEWFNANVLKASDGASTVHRKLLFAQWYTPDLMYNGGTYAFAQRFGSKIAMDGLRVSAYSHVDVKIQNTTASDGASKDKQQIDANPLRGKLFCFSTPYPQVRDLGIQSGVLNNQQLLQVDANNDGIIVPTSDLVGSWRSVPAANAFSRCTGVSSVFLAPGQVKTFSLHFKYNGLISRWGEGTEQNALDETRTRSKNMWGTCKLLVLEHVIGNGATDVQYHMDYTVGAMVTRRTVAPLNKAYRTAV